MATRGGMSFTIAITLAMFMVVLLAVRWPYLQAKLVPLVVAGTTLVLALVQVAREIAGRRKRQAQERTKEEPSEGITPRGYLFEGGWMVGFALGVYLVGFAIAVPGFAGSYVKAHGAKWSMSVGWAILLTGLCYAIFKYLLQADMFNGVLLGWLDLV